MSIRAIWKLLRETLKSWTKDDASRLAAALAFYAAISIAPIFVIIVTVVGFVFDQASARQQLITRIEGLVGTEGAEFLNTLLTNASQPTLGSVAGLVSLGVLLWGSTNLFSQLKHALNIIWNVDEEQGGSWVSQIWSRLTAFGLVVGIGLVLIISVVLSATLATITRWFDDLLPGFGWLWQLANFALSVGIVTLLFAVVFKVLPDTAIAWRDVWIGAAVTALLFMVGNYLLSFYLSRQDNAVYGAAGSAMAFLLWVYYSAQIFFFGAEFTQVYATQYGAGFHNEQEEKVATANA
jgi:membrane protein